MSGQTPALAQVNTFAASCAWTKDPLCPVQDEGICGKYQIHRDPGGSRFSRNPDSMHINGRFKSSLSDVHRQGLLLPEPREGS